MSENFEPQEQENPADANGMQARLVAMFHPVGPVQPMFVPFGTEPMVMVRISDSTEVMGAYDINLDSVGWDREQLVFLLKDILEDLENPENITETITA